MKCSMGVYVRKLLQVHVQMFCLLALDAPTHMPIAQTPPNPSCKLSRGYGILSCHGVIILQNLCLSDNYSLSKKLLLIKTN